MSSNVVKVKYNFEERRWDNLTIEQVKMWEEAFPLCDVVDILAKKIPVWLDANPQKAKSYKNWKKFIVNWLSRQQERYEQFRR